MKFLHVLLVGLLGVLTFSAKASSPTLTDFWNGNATFQLEQSNVGSGHAFHFPSMIWEGNEIWAYYIQNYWVSTVPRSAIARARFLPTATEVLGEYSTGGKLDIVRWDGLAMDISGRPKFGYWATNLHHQVGQAHGTGWAAMVANHSPGFMTYGPNATNIAAGPHSAMFELMVDVRTSATNVAVTLDVYDSTSNTVLNSRNVRIRDFTANNEWKLFYVNFTNSPGSSLEFRAHWKDEANIVQQWVGVAEGTWTFFDDRLASFPGIWKDNGVFYLTYEGAGSHTKWPGDIGLATSTDGWNFQKLGGNTNPRPLLTHNTNNFEKANIGTPSLYKEGLTWYLLYHGFDGVKVRNGVAYGTSLTNLTKWPSATLDVGPAGSWDSGTAGKRSSIVKESSYYYMAYEGSTDQPFDTANWSSGLARSTDLINWTKYSTPIVPVITGGFGNDGPEIIKIGNSLFLYVRNVFNNSDRYKLVWN